MGTRYATKVPGGTVLKLKSLASRGWGRLPKGETWELTKGQGLPKLKTKHSGAPPTQERKRR